MKPKPSKYAPLPFPFPGPFAEMTKKEAKEGFELLMSQKLERIEYFCGYVEAHTGKKFSTGSTFDELDELPALIASIGGRKKVPFWVRIRQYSDVSRNLRDIVQEHESKWEPSLDTILMAFDLGVLWGDSLIAKYPAAKWIVCPPPKRRMDFQYPVIVGPIDQRIIFNPIKEINWSINEILNGETNSWRISKLSPLRVQMLGLDDFESFAHGG